MKTTITLLAVIVSFLNFQSSTLLAQGSLTPPGAPAPTMKTLDQIEPRTAISSTPFTVTQSGAYYLTTNLVVNTGNAITIATNGVTLDLNGFTISSTAASATGYGILLNGGLSDITISNGHIRGGVSTNGSGVYGGSGFGYGIAYSSISPSNVRVSGVSVSGCLYDGISPGLYSTVVDSCTVYMVGGSGIVADTITHSTALYCGETAIDAVAMVSDCFGYCTGNGDGVNASTVEDCQGYSDGDGSGVGGNVVKNCYAWSNGNGDGVAAMEANNCTGQSFGGGDGVNATIASECWGYGFIGIETDEIAIGCGGYASLVAGGMGIQSPIANSCFSNTGDSGITHTYNMP